MNLLFIVLKLSKEYKIGIVVTVALVILIWGLSYLKGEYLFTTKQEYFAIYDRIEGLVEANPILVNGFKVGQVSDVFFYPDNSGKVVVKFTIDNTDIKIAKDSRALIYSFDLLGSKAVELILGADSVYLQSGDTLMSDIEGKLEDAVRAEIKPLKDKAVELIGSIDSAITIVRMVLNKEARSSLTKSFESITRALETLEQTSVSIDELITGNKQRLNNTIQNIESITSNISNNKEQITNAINNFSAISDSLAKADLITAVNNASNALKETALTLDKINKGEGTLGQLIHNDSLYYNLEKAAFDVDKLVKDMNEYPKKYVHFSIFGRKDKSYKKKDKN